MRAGIVVVAAALLAAEAGTARAQELTPEEARAKAVELNKQGAEMVAKKDWAGALAKFQEAYGYLASPKVLLNIGAMLVEVGNKVEAANVYQRWLDDPGGDSAKRTEVTTTLTKLDADLAVLSIKVTPADAEIGILGWQPGWLLPPADLTVTPWIPAPQAARVRIPAGSYSIKARRDGYKPTDVSGTATAGSSRSVELTLSELKEIETPVVTDNTPPPVDPDEDLVIEDKLPVEAPEPPAMQLGAVVDVAIDASKFEGAAVSPGVSVRLINKFEAVGKAQIGGAKGFYLGAVYYILDGKLRPQIGAGMPLFFSDGARVGVRGSAGVCYDLGARLSVVGELGAEYFFNPEMDRLSFSIVPVLGVHARL